MSTKHDHDYYHDDCGLCQIEKAEGPTDTERLDYYRIALKDSREVINILYESLCKTPGKNPPEPPALEIPDEYK